MKMVNMDRVFPHKMSMYVWYLDPGEGMCTGRGRTMRGLYPTFGHLVMALNAYAITKMALLQTQRWVRVDLQEAVR